jgi:hypothetical protein
MILSEGSMGAFFKETSCFPCTGEFSDSPVHKGHSPIPLSSLRAER